MHILIWRRTMRSNDSLNSLLAEKSVIIPIIQRDYAQGRNNVKAIAVRNRLIDDWIDVLDSNDLKMDFNYIYGNESKDEFYPVDGQQRLTSLYLLYWYLAYANNNTDMISNWKFDYKTRNSASEFFSFMKEESKAKKLFDILNKTNCDDYEKEKTIKNENWFKLKWENDPTVTAAINFLITLASKLEKKIELEQKEKLVVLQAFWNRLIDEENGCAIYFTYLPEASEKYAEITAAKKYTRMNARGKRLTDFENLKAMLDEIESDKKNQLQYCNPYSKKKTISYAYDQLYIDVLYKEIKKQSENSLNDIVIEINEESYNWYKLIYVVYALLYEKDIPKDLCKFMGVNDMGSGEDFENTIYKISQKRINLENIQMYLWMLKAVQEVNYNSEADTVIWRYSGFFVGEDFEWKMAIAFIIFVKNMWNEYNTNNENSVVIMQWKRFENMLNDLKYLSWQVTPHGLVKIINTLSEEIAKQNRSVDKYFVENNFEKNNPFLLESEDLKDIKCRILEQQIKSKLLIDGAISDFNCLDDIMVDRRMGYFFYITGCFVSWKKDINMKSQANLIADYMEILHANNMPSLFQSSDYFLKAFAFASQYDHKQGNLKTESEINNCNNDHLWMNNHYLTWDDDEYEILGADKMTHLDNLKTMLELLSKYKIQNNCHSNQVFCGFISNCNNWFNSNGGYENCWLRISLKSHNARTLLNKKLERNSGGEVCIDNNPFILSAFLLDSGYLYSDTINLSKGTSKIWGYFEKEKARVLEKTKQPLTFKPNPENDGKYQHSNNQNMDLCGNVVNRNLDLEYCEEIEISDTIYKNGNFIAYYYNGKTIDISVYVLNSKKNNKIEIKVTKTQIQEQVIEQIKQGVNNWMKEFENIVSSAKSEKVGQYDKWIELWFWNSANNYHFLDTSLPGNAQISIKGGQRPKRVWNNIKTLSGLNWIGSVELY